VYLRNITFATDAALPDSQDPLYIKQLSADSPAACSQLCLADKRDASYPQARRRCGPSTPPVLPGAALARRRGRPACSGVQAWGGLPTGGRQAGECAPPAGDRRGRGAACPQAACAAATGVPLCQQCRQAVLHSLLGSPVHERRGLSGAGRPQANGRAVNCTMWRFCPDVPGGCPSNSTTPFSALAPRACQLQSFFKLDRGYAQGPFSKLGSQAQQVTDALLGARPPPAPLRPRGCGGAALARGRAPGRSRGLCKAGIRFVGSTCLPSLNCLWRLLADSSGGWVMLSARWKRSGADLAQGHKQTRGPQLLTGQPSHDPLCSTR
jgi:hypothetical protein